MYIGVSIIEKDRDDNRKLPTEQRFMIFCVPTIHFIWKKSAYRIRHKRRCFQ